MAAELDIYNFALSNIGISTFIGNITEPSDARRICSRWYAQCRDEVLRDFPWPFATKATTLSLLTDEFPGWTYAYQYPDDCLRMGTVTNADGARWQRGFFWCFDNTLPSPLKVPARVALSADGNGQVILTDQDAAWLIYIARVTVTTVFQPDFVSALSWLLAARIAPALQAKADFQQGAWRAYQQVISNTWANALNEISPDQKADSPSILVR